MDIFPEVGAPKGESGRKEGIILPFAGGAYKVPSPDYNAQTCINLYLTVDSQGGFSPRGEYLRPGYELFYDFNGYETRGIFEENNILYAVIDNRFITLDQYLNETVIGTLKTNSGRVSMISNGLQIEVTDTFYKYCYTAEDNTFIEISDETHVVPIVLTYQDGYGIYVAPGTNTFYLTGLYNFSIVDPLDFASANGTPDDLVSAVSTHQELWLFSRSTAEIWYNVGNVDFPFERRQTLLIKYGCAAPNSVALVDNGQIIWLSRNREGQALIVMAEGFVPKVLTVDDAVSLAINSYSRIDDAFAIVMQLNSHVFYILTFPTADRTWAYDLKTDNWVEWRSTILNTQPSVFINRQGRYRANCFALFLGKSIIGDFQSGKLYRVGLDLFSDDGAQIWTERTTPTYHSQQATLFFSTLELVAQQGVGNISGQDTNPQVMLTISKNGTHTFGQESTRPLGNLGNFTQDTRWNRLGKAKRFTFKYRTVGTNQIAFIEQRANVQKGKV